MFALAQTQRVDKSKARKQVLEVVQGLIALRTAAGISQYRLAELTGLSRETIRQVEAGQTSPTLTTLFLISTALEAKLAPLIKGAESG